VLSCSICLCERRRIFLFFGEWASFDALSLLLHTEEEDFNWEIDQEVPAEPMISDARYGFNLQYSGFFGSLQDEVLAIIDIVDPENSTQASRRELRLQLETDKFDEDYYMYVVAALVLFPPFLFDRPDRWNPNIQTGLIFWNQIRLRKS